MLRTEDISRMHGRKKLYNCQGIVTISAHHDCELLALHTKLRSIENSGKLLG